MAESPASLRSQDVPSEVPVNPQSEVPDNILDESNLQSEGSQGSKGDQQSQKPKETNYGKVTQLHLPQHQRPGLRT